MYHFAPSTCFCLKQDYQPIYAEIIRVDTTQLDEKLQSSVSEKRLCELVLCEDINVQEVAFKELHTTVQFFSLDENVTKELLLMFRSKVKILSQFAHLFGLDQGVKHILFQGSDYNSSNLKRGPDQ